MTEQTDQTALDGLGDLIVVESREPIPRALEGMQGVYTLDGWRDASGNSREFACEIVKISPTRLGCWDRSQER